MHFILLRNTKVDILKNIGIQTFSDPIDLRSIFDLYCESKWKLNGLVNNIPQNIICIFQKKEKPHESNIWQNVKKKKYWMDYPLKPCHCRNRFEFVHFHQDNI